MATRLYTHNQKVYILLCVVRVGLLCGRVCSAYICSTRALDALQNIFYRLHMQRKSPTRTADYSLQSTYAAQEPYTRVADPLTNIW